MGSGAHQLNMVMRRFSVQFLVLFALLFFFLARSHARSHARTLRAFDRGSLVGAPVDRSGLIVGWFWGQNRLPIKGFYATNRSN